MQSTRFTTVCLAAAALGTVCAFAPPRSTSRSSYCKASGQRAHHYFASPATRLHSNRNNGGGPKWIRDAMGDGFDADDEGEGGDAQEGSATAAAALEEGLAGFSVDPDLGFVAILVADSSLSSAKEQKWVYSVVSPQDKTQLMSAEALTLVQLAGGIDVGAAVLPPEALMRIVKDETLDDDGDDDDDDESGASDIKKARLVGVEAVPRVVVDTAGRSEEDAATALPKPSSPERNERISTDAVKLFATIRKLPGLAEATESSVKEAMRMHADAHGAINREAFSNILDTLRRGANAGASDALDGVEFGLTVQIVRENGREGLVKVRSPSTFHALGLSMRYSAPIIVSQDCFATGEDNGGGNNAFGFGRDDLLRRFPAFRPMRELLEDAQAVDGFIANMFYKENAPRSFE